MDSERAQSRNAADIHILMIGKNIPGRADFCFIEIILDNCRARLRESANEEDAMGDTHSEPEQQGASLVWKSRPIFLSSTFKDMNLERDYLRAHGLKELEDKLRERCHYLDAIDLRQGVETGDIADEAEREFQVLKVCLDEIDRSKPFLVGILGDRYGWVPDPLHIEAAAQRPGLPRSVEVAGKSVTELEILYGVLENPDQKKRSRFYFRTVDRTGMPPDNAAKFLAEAPDSDPTSPAGRLKALKERIKREMPDRWRDYTLKWDGKKGALTGLEEFDAQVVTDLWEDLDAETAEYLREAPKTWQEAEARAVADFVAERTRGYVERRAVTDPLVAHALSPTEHDGEWGLVLSGPSGSGKSNLFSCAYLTLADRAAKGELLLLSHAAGIFPMSGDVDRMLRRWSAELAAFLGVPDPIKAAEAEDARRGDPLERLGERPRVTSEDIEIAFAGLLGQAARKLRVVLLIDALNQFEPTVRARYLTWLPKLWPPNARFIATTLPGDAGASLKERPGCREMTVPPVSREEAREIAERFYRERHHRDVNPRVLDALLDKKLPDDTPAHGNPLWLALALQEMNLLEADDFERAEREYAHLTPVERMEALQLSDADKLPPDIPGAYGELVARAERVCGAGPTRAFANLIAISRSGWRESDLRNRLMESVSGEPWDEVVFAGIRRTFGMHVVQRGAHAQWDFFHVSLRATILLRELTDEDVQRKLHGKIADHLDGLKSDDPLRISETMVHLIGLGDRDRTAEYLAGAAQQRGDNPKSLAGAVAATVESIQNATSDTARERLTTWIAELMRGGSNERVKIVARTVLFDLNDALAITGATQTEVGRHFLLQAVRTTAVRLCEEYPYGPEEALLSYISLEKLGDFYTKRSERGDMDRAFAARQASLEVAERCIQLKSNFDRTIVARQVSPEIKERLERLYSSDMRHMIVLSVALKKMGDSYLGRGAPGDAARALETYQRSREIDQGRYDCNPDGAREASDLSLSLVKLGDLYLLRGQSGDANQALRAFQEALNIDQRLYDTQPDNEEAAVTLASTLSKLGDFYLRRWSSGDSSDAYKVCQASLEIMRRLHEANPQSTETAHLLNSALVRMGEFYQQRRDFGDAERSLEAYRGAMKIARRFYEKNPNDGRAARDLSGSHYTLGIFYHRRGESGDSNQALEAFQASLEIAQILYEANPSFSQAARDLSRSQEALGAFYMQRGESGDAARAFEALQASLEVDQRLYEANPDARTARNLSSSYYNLALLAHRNGDWVRAEEGYRASFTLLNSMYQRNVPLGTELTQIYQKLAAMFSQ